MSAPIILLVEDDPDIQESLRLFLELEGFTVESAHNGAEAFAYLLAKRPASVILLDLMMPIMNGYEFLEKAQAFGTPEAESVCGIPIVVLSAATDLERVARERDVRFVKKPIDLDRLLEVIRS